MPAILLLLAPLAGAAPFEVTLRDPVRGPVSPDDYDLLLEEAAGLAPEGATSVTLFGLDAAGVRRPLASFLPTSPPVPVKDDERRSMPVDHPGPGEGFLSGKTVYASQCHGLMYYDSLGGFSTQRPVLFDTVEDFHNPEGFNQYLMAYLQNAGAAVFTARERDMNDVSGIADNDGAGYAEAGSGFVAGEKGFREGARWDYGVDPFDAGTTRRFPADGNAVATWTPDVPRDGHFAVYVSWDSDAGNAPDAHYRIHHPGGVIDRWFDQRVHGSTWQYLETLWLPKGTSGLKIELVGDSGHAGTWLSADAVRVGGGRDDVVRRGEVTDRPRWEASAIQYTQYNGAPKSIYDVNANGIGTDHTTRSRWAAWEHPTGEEAVYLSWHSNAGGGRGTSTYTWDGSDATAGSWELGEYVQDELMNAARTLYDGAWKDRGHLTAQFSEVNPNHNPEMPAALVELAFHDHETDAAYLKEPEFRRDMSRAMYRAIVRWFAWKNGTTARFLPEPPVGVALVHGADGRLEVSWEPGAVGDPFGDAATGYVLQTSKDGLSWDAGTAVTGTKTVLDTPKGGAVYVRISAENDGGRSFPSEVVGALRSADGQPAVLVVSAFDRLDRGLLVETATSVGSVQRMDLRHMNAYDVAVAHGEAIRATRWPFDTVSDEAFAGLDLSRYRAVVWIAGEESTADESFSDAQQARIRDYVGAGGTLWVTGAEILWDLDYRGSAGDKAFAADVLGATLADDASGTYGASGEGVLDGVGPLDFGMEHGAPYPVEWPDVLASQRDVIARYDGGGVAGVLGGGVALFGFPFEAIGDPSVRAEVAIRLLPALVPDYDPPEVEVVDTGDTGETDTGGPDETGLVRDRVKACGCASGAPSGLFPAVVLALLLRRRR